MRRSLNRLVIGLGLLLPLIAPAATTTAVSVVPTLARTVFAYDASSVCVVSDNALSGSEATVQLLLFFDPDGQKLELSDKHEDLRNILQGVVANKELPWNAI